MVKYKLFYTYEGVEHTGNVIGMNLLTKTATVIHNHLQLSLPYTKKTLIEFTKYYDGNDVELYEGDHVKLGHWAGTIMKRGNIFVIATNDKQDCFINLHEVYSEEKEDEYGNYYTVPSVIIKRS
jgi:hypothetical protein